LGSTKKGNPKAEFPRKKMGNLKGIKKGGKGTRAGRNGVGGPPCWPER